MLCFCSLVLKHVNRFHSSLEILHRKYMDSIFKIMRYKINIKHKKHTTHHTIHMAMLKPTTNFCIVLLSALIPIDSTYYIIHTKAHNVKCSIKGNFCCFQWKFNFLLIFQCFIPFHRNSVLCGVLKGACCYWILYE